MFLACDEWKKLIDSLDDTSTIDLMKKFLQDMIREARNGVLAYCQSAKFANSSLRLAEY